ncbi:hypothetical protein EYZ11_013034 [Aspergillus tanneri]|uniref:Uncharacterized protein n=1 Tax=Aspergillus tanneri TaxID=1220188 RepID=A0A4S3J0T4_9EURO|nr:hypothetical protein EYZ11_013034 [Aspergillus tanneri]
MLVFRFENNSLYTRYGRQFRARLYIYIRADGFYLTSLSLMIQILILLLYHHKYNSNLLLPEHRIYQNSTLRANICTRDETVIRLAEILDLENIVHIRGTPASGKRKYPSVEKVQHFFAVGNVVILDEAQGTYEDTAL